MSETIEDIVREMREIRPDCDDCISNHTCDYLSRFSDRIEAAYKNMAGMWIIPAENAKLREENARLKAALKPVQDAHIPDFSICDTCRDRSECEKNEDSETCEWYDIVKAVRESHKIYDGGAK